MKDKDLATVQILIVVWLLRVAQLDSGILIKGTQDTIRYLLDAAEASFGSPEKGPFDEIVLYRLGNNFFKAMQKLLAATADCDSDLPEEGFPKTSQELMEIVITETSKWRSSVHATVCNPMILFENDV